MGKNIKFRIYPSNEQKGIFENVFACQQSIFLETLAITQKKLEKINKVDNNKNSKFITKNDEIENNHANYTHVNNNVENISNKLNNSLNLTFESSENQLIQSNEQLNELEQLKIIKELNHTLDDFRLKKKRLSISKNKNEYLYLHNYSTKNQFVNKNQVLSNTKYKIFSVLNVENKNTRKKLLENLVKFNYFIVDDFNDISIDYFKKTLLLPNMEAMRIDLTDQDIIYLIYILETLQLEPNTYLITVKKSSKNLYYLQIQIFQKFQNIKKNNQKEQEDYKIVNSTINVQNEQNLQNVQNRETENNEVANNKFIKLNKNIKKIKREKRSYSKKLDNSKNKQKQAVKIAKLNKRIQNQKNAMMRSYQDKYKKQNK